MLFRSVWQRDEFGPQEYHSSLRVNTAPTFLVGIDTHLAELVFANLEGRIAYYPLDFRPEVVGTVAAVAVIQHNDYIPSHNARLLILKRPTALKKIVSLSP